MINMRNTHSFITCFQIYRCINSSSAYSNLYRESKFIKKILHGTHKSKRKWYDQKADLKNALGEHTNKVSAQTMRRMEVRNKLFMKHITDLISMGHVSNIVHGNIEITYVKITSDYKFINVYWIHTNDDVSSLVTAETLEKCAKIIRHELSQLRVIGIVPPIQFVEDKQMALQKEIEKRLILINVEKNESELYSEEIELCASRIANQTFKKRQDTNQDLNHDSTIDESKIDDSKIDESYIELPVMRHDVLGLDHNKIMNRIIASVSKSKEAAQRHIDANLHVDKSSCNIVSKEYEFLTQKEHKQIFAEFLTTKRKEERRLNRAKKLREHELLKFQEGIKPNYDIPEDYNDEKNEEFEDYYNEDNSEIQ